MTQPTVRECLNTLGYTSGDHDADVRGALLELMVARASQEQLTKDAARWQVIRDGLFIAARDKRTGEVELVYQSGSMDEVAAELRSSLTTDPTGPVFDCADVIVDEFIRRHPAR